MVGIFDLPSLKKLGQISNFFCFNTSFTWWIPLIIRLQNCSKCPLLTWIWIVFGKKSAWWHFNDTKCLIMNSLVWILFPTPWISCPNFKYLLKFGFDPWTPYPLGQCHEICTFFILKSSLTLCFSYNFWNCLQFKFAQG